MPWCPQRLRGDPSRETDARPSASSLTTRRLNRSAYLLNDTLSAVNWMPGRGSVARERRHDLTRPTSKVSSLHFDSPRAMELPFRERTCQQVKSRVRTCRHPAKVSLMGRALYASCHEALRAVRDMAVRLALRGPGLASVRSCAVSHSLTSVLGG